MTVADWVQIASAIVTLAAVAVALYIAARDRRHALTIAEDDRRSNAKQARLLF